MRQVNEDLGNDGRKKQQNWMLLDAESELAAWVQAALKDSSKWDNKGGCAAVGLGRCTCRV
jgi:hypothetical protein